MNSIRIALSPLLLALFLLPTLSFGQSQEGTIEASWNRAPAAPRTLPPVEKARPVVKGAQYPDPAWDKQRSPESRPWPSLSAHPTVNEYHQANTAVIDSLARLYCLSSNYIGTLRIRNEQALQSKEPHMRDFDYDGKPAAPKQGQQSLQALHKELMLLLERCLVGR